MITNLNYPLDSTKRKKSLSRLTWSQIKSIADAGSADKLFTLGDTKDGATLVHVEPTQAIFALTNLGQACIAQYEDGHQYSVSSIANYSMYKSGWYTNTSYAGNRGVTYNSIMSSLPTDMKNVMYNKLRYYTAYRTANYGQKYKEHDWVFVYVPTQDEWTSYSAYMPQTGTYWLESIESYATSWSGSSYGTYVIDYMYFNAMSNGTFTQSYGFRDSINGRYGYETAGLVLLFEVR